MGVSYPGLAGWALVLRQLLTTGSFWGKPGQDCYFYAAIHKPATGTWRASCETSNHLFGRGEHNSPDGGAVVGTKQVRKLAVPEYVRIEPSRKLVYYLWA